MLPSNPTDATAGGSPVVEVTEKSITPCSLVAVEEAYTDREELFGTLLTRTGVDKTVVEKPVV